MRRLLLCTALVLFAPAVHAQSAADVATARDLFKDGLDLRDKGKLTEALAKLRAAHDLYETPPSTLELGRTEMLLGQLATAYETLLSVERITPVAKESDRSKTARADARKLAADLRTRIPTLQVNVEGATDDSAVLLDGSSVPASLFGVPRKLDPGHHVVVAKNAAGAEARVETDLAERDVKSVTVVVPALAALPRPIGPSEPAAVVVPDPAMRFGVLYKFLPPPPDGEAEQWTLRDAKGAALCSLPCEHWLGDANGAYLERTMKDDEARRVDLPQQLPAPVGSTVTVRPTAGKGYPALATVGSVAAGLGALGVLLGIPFAVVGALSNSPSGPDFLLGGLVTTTAAVVLLVGGVALGVTNRTPALVIDAAPTTHARVWLTPFGAVGTF